MDLFTYLLKKKGHNSSVNGDLFSYLLASRKRGTYQTYNGTQINVIDSVNARMKNWILGGNSNQNGTPTPDAPIDIQTVTGNQKINIFGKNYFDKTNPNVKNIYIDSTNYKIGNLANARSIYVPCRPNTNYTVSKIATPRFIVGLTDVIPENNVTCLGIIRDDSATSLTITGNANAKYLVVFLTNAYDSNTWQNILDSIQIEEGNSATSYEQYSGTTFPISLGNIELNKIGNYQDKIYKSNDKWYLEKNTDKIILDGVNNQAILYNHYDNFERLGFNFSNIKLSGFYEVQNKNYIVCNMLENNGSDNKPSVNTILSWNTENRSFGFFEEGLFNSLATANEWLSSNNLIAYYVYNTPVITEITDDNLINQLEELAKARSFENQTNISQLSEQLPFDLTVDIKTL